MEPTVENPASSTSALSAWEALEKLAAANVTPREFWSRFAVSLRDSLSAAVVLAVHRAGPDQPWRVIGSAVDGPAARQLSGEEFVKMGPGLADALFTGGIFPRRLKMSDGRETLALAAVISSRREGEQAAALALCRATGPEALLHAQIRAAAVIPSAWEARAAIERAEADRRNLTNVLDLVAVTNAEERFGAAALAFCNAAAAQYGCDRASLGWPAGGYTRLAAISRHEHVDRKMETPQRIEAAMDECLDQDEEIAWPAPADATFVARDHQRLAEDDGSGNILTVPLHQGDKAVAALLCERAGQPFTPAEVSGLRLACEQVAPRLATLRARDRWPGARFAAWLRQHSAKLLGPRHTLAKLFALFVAVLLAVLVFWHTEYRIEGNFLLRSENVSNLTAPIDGYIKEVLVRNGDHVNAGQVLLRLNTDALKVEESAAFAELERYGREEEKARASGAVAEMQIAGTLARQAAAKLEIVRFRLAQSDIKSRMDGVIIEGDLKERLDAPVKQGDPLFRVAELSGYFLDVQLDERDAHEVAAGASGECAFLSDPENSLPLKVDSVLPSAVEKDGVSVFSARAKIQSPEDIRWRPGMSGIAKINSGERSLLWIITHRTVDFLRLKLWW
jgi:multidrug resistance efflux pump